MHLFLVLVFFFVLLADNLARGTDTSITFWQLASLPLCVLLAPTALALHARMVPRSVAGSAPLSSAGQFLAMSSWLLSSLLIVGVLNWGSVIRAVVGQGEWESIGYPLILLPSIASLVMIWLVSFELEDRAETVRPAIARRKRRWDYLRIRVQVYLLIALLPLVVISSGQAVLGAGSRHFEWPGLTIVSGTLALLVALLATPWLLTTAWRVHSLKSGALRERLESIAQECRVSFARIGIWPTGNRIANALIVGCLPRRKTLLLTDGLLQLLTPDELGRVVAHEAAHIRFVHLPQRLLIVAWPLAAVIIAAWLNPRLLPQLEVWAEQAGLSMAAVSWVILPTVYVTYLYLTLGIASRRMETEADLFACTDRTQTSESDSSLNRLDAEKSELFCQALLKLAAVAGTRPDRTHWLHPSLFQRIVFLRRAVQCPALATSFKQRCRSFRYTFVAAAAATLLLMLIL